MATRTEIQVTMNDASLFSTNSQWSQIRADISVVMLGFRDAHLLERAIRTFVASASGAWEFVLVLNGASSSVTDLARKLLAENAFPLRIVTLAGCRPGAARNHGVRASRASLLLFLDDDTETFQDITAAMTRIFSDPSVKAAGGANLTSPHSGALERATGAAMASWFVAGPMRGRYRVGKEGPADEHSLILCNLAVRRDVFESQRGFATQLVSNEENVLLQRLEAQGSRLWQSPALSVYHRRRQRWRGLFEQAMKYGAGRAQNLLVMPQTIHPRYFLPLALVLYISLAPLMDWAWLIPVAIYILCASLIAAGGAIFHGDPALLLQVGVIPCVHLGYGLGFLRALFQWVTFRKRLLDHAL